MLSKDSDRQAKDERERELQNEVTRTKYQREEFELISDCNDMKDMKENA